MWCNCGVINHFEMIFNGFLSKSVFFVKEDASKLSFRMKKGGGPPCKKIYFLVYVIVPSISKMHV